MKEPNWKVIAIVVTIIGIIGITLGLSMSFVLVEDDEEFIDDPYDPFDPINNDPIIDPIQIDDDVAPTIYATIYDENLPTSGYLLTYENDVSIGVSIRDNHLVYAVDPTTSLIEYTIYSVNDVSSASIQIQSQQYSGYALKDMCGLIVDEFYTRCDIEINVEGLVCGYEYELYIDAIDYLGNVAELNHAQFRFMLPPGEVTVESWIPREERYLDIQFHVEHDILVRTVDAYFTNGEGDLMTDIETGEIYFISCEEVSGLWEFTWDTDIFPEGQYTIKCRVRFGETLLMLEEWKYEKYYNTGTTFLIIHETTPTNNPSVGIAPGFGVGVGFAGITVISLILIITRTNKFGDDENKTRKIIKVPK